MKDFPVRLIHGLIHWGAYTLQSIEISRYNYERQRRDFKY